MLCVSVFKFIKNFTTYLDHAINVIKYGIISFGMVVNQLLEIQGGFRDRKSHLVEAINQSLSRLLKLPTQYS